MPFKIFRENKLTVLKGNQKKPFLSTQALLPRPLTKTLVANDLSKIEPRKNMKAQGVLTVYATRNNTHVCFENFSNKKIIKKSLGTLKKSSVRKKSLYIHYLLGSSFGQMLQECQTNLIEIKVYGFNRGQVDFLRGLKENKIKIVSLQQRIGQPHNGCRPKKRRRLLLNRFQGWVTEWSKVSVLKTDASQEAGGSNPSPPVTNHLLLRKKILRN